MNGSIRFYNGMLAHAEKMSHQMALEKSGADYEKYKEDQKELMKEASLKEIEEDIKKLKKSTT